MGQNMFGRMRPTSSPNQYGIDGVTKVGSSGSTNGYSEGDMKPKPAGMKAEHFVFCRELIRNQFSDIAGAYMKAYPDAKESSAAPAGSRLLRDVPAIQEYLTEVSTAAVEATSLEAKHIIERMLAIAFTNITDVASWNDEEGLQIKPSDQIPEHNRAAIAEVTERVGLYGARLSLKLHNPGRILNMLGQYLRMFSPDEPDRNPNEDDGLTLVNEVIIERPEVGPTEQPKQLTKPKRRRRRA